LYTSVHNCVSPGTDGLLHSFLALCTILTALAILIVYTEYEKPTTD